MLSVHIVFILNFLLITHANAASAMGVRGSALGEVSDDGKGNATSMRRVEVLASGEVSGEGSASAASITRMRPLASGEVSGRGHAGAASMMRAEVLALGGISYDDSKDPVASSNRARRSAANEVSESEALNIVKFKSGGAQAISDGRMSSAHEVHHASNATHQVRNQLVDLLLLTTMFVFVGFMFGVFFPNFIDNMVEQMIKFKRFVFSQERLGGKRKNGKRKTGSSNAFFKDFEIGEKIGEGAFGVVHIVRQDGKNFAVKMIDVMEADLNLVREEVAILKRVQHARLTTGCLYEYSDECFHYLVMPLYDGGDLSGVVSDYIQKNGLLTEPLFARLFEQMAKGVAFVQSRLVVHRDIKPENFLLASSKLSDPGNNVVVADFGLSAVLDDGGFLHEVCGTPIFWSPELFAGKYEFKVDVFALGLSAYVLLTGRFAFSTEKESRTWASSSDPPPIPPSISPGTQEIIRRALARDVPHRANSKELETLATELRSHTFDADMNARRQSAQPEPPKIVGFRTFGISGGEIHNKRAERRRRMLRELIKEHYGSILRDAGTSDCSAEVLAARPFEIRVGRRNRKVSRYEFWYQKDCLEKRISGTKDEDMEPLAQVTEVQPSVVQLLDDVLSRYKVERDRWGQGKAKSTTDLARECRNGTCLLTHGQAKLERVVEIVAFIVMNSERKILHQLPQVHSASFGRKAARAGGKASSLAVPFSAAKATFTSFSQPRLPGKKMEAWETLREATDRVLDMLNMSPVDVDVDFDVPMRVFRQASTSFPGLMTVYKKHMVNVWIREEDCSVDQLALWGLPGSNNFEGKSEEGVSHWGWMDEDDTAALGTLSEGEVGLAMRYAEVLPVKTKVISGDEIKQILRQTNAKVEDMSDFALEKLAEQIRTGEVELVEEEEPDGTRTWKRKVTVTMLRLAHQDGSILLEVSTSKDGGATWIDKTGLPAATQHTFENPFYIARKMLTSRFMVAEGRWRMEKDVGGCIIEETESDQLPGLPTVYTKHIVAARLC